MSCECSPAIYELGCATSGATWGGFTAAIKSPSTELVGTLSLVQMAVMNEDGVKVLELTSGVSGEITINDNTANGWNFTIEPRTIGLSAGVHSYVVRLTDSNATKVDWIAGTWPIKQNNF